MNKCHYPNCMNPVDLLAPSCCRNRYCELHWRENHPHEPDMAKAADADWRSFSEKTRSALRLLGDNEIETVQAVIWKEWRIRKAMKRRAHWRQISHFFSRLLQK